MTSERDLERYARVRRRHRPCIFREAGIWHVMDKSGRITPLAPSTT